MLARAAWIAVLVLCVAVALPASAQAAPVSGHAELYTCCTPHGEKERIFSEARALGATYIRANVELSDIFQSPSSPPNWSRLDDVIALSRRYRVRVLGLLLEVPAWLSTCPTGSAPGICPPRDMHQFGVLASRVAAHSRGDIRHWQILNEPSLNWGFTGTPEDYGRILSASSDAIKRAAPEDLVVIGNTYVNADEQAWARRVFKTAGAGRKYDIGAVNFRTDAQFLAIGMKVFRRFLAENGFHGPIWVLEHGYPADQPFQYDPAFQGGDAAQVSYLRYSLRALDAAGAGEIFVTLHHRSTNKYTSEGLIDFGGPPAYPASRRPAFAAVRDWVNEWHRKQLGYRERAGWLQRRSRLHRLAAADADGRAHVLRKRARKARRRERRYLRRAKRLRARARRYEACCEADAARALADAKRAKRRAKLARKSRRNNLRRARRYIRRAEKHSQVADSSALQALTYGRLIKPLS